jgi:Cu+-exporting ATPase
MPRSSSIPAPTRRGSPTQARHARAFGCEVDAGVHHARYGLQRLLDAADAITRAGYTVARHTLDLHVDGMTCASCVGRVEKALKAVPGVVDASVNLATEGARVTRLGDAAGDAELVAAIERAGYGATLVVDASNAGVPRARTRRDEGWKVALAALLSAPLVLPMLGDLVGAHWMLPAGLQFALATPVQFWLGARFYRAGWSALRAGAGNMDLLVALGTSAAYGLSLVLWARAADAMAHLYFESAAVGLKRRFIGAMGEVRPRRRCGAATPR